MSVILFAKEQVYRKLADAYEGLHGLLHASREDDERFYKSLRRLYFANVATFLCQYHNEPGLPQEELIDDSQKIGFWLTFGDTVRLLLMLG